MEKLKMMENVDDEELTMDHFMEIIEEEYLGHIIPYKGRRTFWDKLQAVLKHYDIIKE